MTLKQLVERTGWEPLVLTEEDREVTGGFSGDLLSWVMGHGEAGQVWVTVQTHLNVVAVAVLREFSCLIIANDAEISEEMLNRAKEEQLNVLCCHETAFEACRKLIEAGL